MQNRPTDHSVDLRQNGETIATIACDADGRALRVKPLFVAVHRIESSPGLDVYEGDTRLHYDSTDTKGVAFFQDPQGKDRLALHPGGLGPWRAKVVDSTPGVNGQLENLVNVCVHIEPLP